MIYDRDGCIDLCILNVTIPECVSSVFLDYTMEAVSAADKLALLEILSVVFIKFTSQAILL